MLSFFENIILLCIVVAALNVLMVNNPVQSLLWLILTFALSSMFFMLLGVELMSILVFMIYIGAIAVLFLFVIMMLNIKIIELRFLYLRYLPIGIVIVCFFILEIFLSIFLELQNFYFVGNDYIFWLNLLNFHNNLYLLGTLIYNYHSLIFLSLGLILLVAMVCSIVLLVDWSHDSSKPKYYKDVYYFKRKKITFLK
jgi:NADH-quinone oxidoreductase subunit J